MADLYSVLPVNSDPKYGLGLLPTDLEAFHFPSVCQDLITEQLLTLDEPQRFFLACPDAGDFGAYDGALSRASTAATPQSDYSARTSHSARDNSPTSDVLSFCDQPAGQGIEAMYHDTTRAIVSGRQSRAVSATWPSSTSSQVGLSSTLTPTSITATHRPQSFSYRTPQVASQVTDTPPLPSNFFPSPNLQPQSMATQSPFASPSLQSSMMPHEAHHSTQHQFMQANSMPTMSTFYAQPQPQSTPVQQQLQQQQFQLSPNLALQQQLQRQQFQQLAFSLPQSDSHRHSIQAQIQSQAQAAANMFSQNSNHTLNNSRYQPTSTQSSIINKATTPPTLPNTTGNSTTGYQCFSHGCGGRHFSNWGNLVRHHRERQLRSKAGAKPTCARCGKGFTRSSARDAHVSGLKCVLGRRRRGANTASGTGSSATNGHASTGSSGGDSSAVGPGAGTSQAEAGGATRGLSTQNSKDSGNTHDYNDAEHNHDRYSEGSREDSGEDEDEDDLEMLGSKPIYDDHDVFLVDNRFGLGANVVDAGRSYLAPQQLSFER